MNVITVFVFVLCVATGTTAGTCIFGHDHIYPWDMKKDNPVDRSEMQKLA